MLGNEITRRTTLGWLPIALMLVASTNAFARGTTFTHQGRLTDSGDSANGTYDLQFKIFPGLNEVMRLQPIRYQYRPDNALGIRFSGEHVGLAAQDVERVIPEAVTKNERGYLLVNNDPIIWAVLNPIKDQQKEIKKQTAENAELKQKLYQQEERLRRLEAAMGRVAGKN